MTKHLHDVLSEIASDAGPVDLLDRVRGETRALRWRRRATVGAVGLGSAGAIVLGAVLVSPTVESPTDPAETAAPVSPLPARLDLTTAPTGGVDAASLIIISGGSLYAVDAADGAVVRIDTDSSAIGDPQLSTQRPVERTHQLSADGTRVVATDLVFFGPASDSMPTPQVSVIDLASGATIYSEPHQQSGFAGTPVGTSSRFSLSPDGDRLVASRYDTNDLGHSIGAPQLEIVDLASAQTTPIDHAAMADRRVDVDPLGGLAWSPDGSRLALSYLNGQDIIEMPTGAVLVTEAVSERLLTDNPWSADSARLLKGTQSSVSTWPAGAAAVGAAPIGSSRIIGIPLGFAGPDLLLWSSSESELVVTSLNGDQVGVTTTIVSDAPVDAVASALATAPG